MAETRHRLRAPGVAAGAALAVLLGALPAGAQPATSAAAPGAPGNWPSHPIRLVVPFSPGGTADTLGRLVARQLGESLKQPWIVENRAGAGGVVGSEVVAHAPADGYTWVVSGVASHVLAPAVSKVPFDPLRDFTHVALFGGPPIALCVNPSLGVADLKEFVATAKSRQLSYGSPGTGTQGQLIAELFKQAAGFDMTHIPYKGASGAIADLMAGILPATSTTLTTASGQIRSGRIKALAITTRRRLPDYPDVPTFEEMGYPKLVASVWFSLSGPAGVPADIVSRLNAEVRKALDAPEVRNRLRLEGIEANELDAEQFTQFVREEVQRWTPIVKGSSAMND